MTETLQDLSPKDRLTAFLAPHLDTIRQLPLTVNAKKALLVEYLLSYGWEKGELTSALGINESQLTTITSFAKARIVDPERDLFYSILPPKQTQDIAWKKPHSQQSRKGWADEAFEMWKKGTTINELVIKFGKPKNTIAPTIYRRTIAAGIAGRLEIAKTKRAKLKNQILELKSAQPNLTRTEIINFLKTSIGKYKKALEELRQEGKLPPKHQS